MKNLTKEIDNIIITSYHVNNLPEDIVSFIKTKQWYINNESASECMIQNTSQLNIERDIKRTSEKLLVLYSDNSYGSSLRFEC